MLSNARSQLPTRRYVRSSRRRRHEAARHDGDAAQQEDHVIVKKPRTYEVTLRRDVQQVMKIRVDASSRQEAIFVAESVIDEDAWSLEECVGTHQPQVSALTGRRSTKSKTQ